jgi:hypothetical protein
LRDECFYGKELELLERTIHAVLTLAANIQTMGLPPWLTQTDKTHIAVRCKNLDREDHCTAF